MVDYSKWKNIEVSAAKVNLINVLNVFVIVYRFPTMRTKHTQI